MLFLEAVVDLIPAVLAYLREDEDRPRMEDELILHHEDNALALPQSGAQAMGKGLDAGEFADFLRRKRA